MFWAFNDIEAPTTGKINPNSVVCNENHFGLPNRGNTKKLLSLSFKLINIETYCALHLPKKKKKRGEDKKREP